ncbi:hypothetical protein BKA69DRAFT_538411 [Paraphysoderma sedebokerense]|nr:hypothetical protein BKA69DRAFT_538411 [Paraphysoderma sedebokerense]
MEQQKKFNVGSAEAEDLLTKLVFVIAPIARLTESLHQYDPSLVTQTIHLSEKLHALDAFSVSPTIDSFGFSQQLPLANQVQSTSTSNPPSRRASTQILSSMDSVSASSVTTMSASATSMLTSQSSLPRSLSQPPSQNPSRSQSNISSMSSIPRSFSASLSKQSLDKLMISSNEKDIDQLNSKSMPGIRRFGELGRSVSFSVNAGSVRKSRSRDNLFEEIQRKLVGSKSEADLEKLAQEPDQGKHKNEETRRSEIEPSPPHPGTKGEETIKTISNIEVAPKSIQGSNNLKSPLLRTGNNENEAETAVTQINEADFVSVVSPHVPLTSSLKPSELINEQAFDLSVPPKLPVKKTYDRRIDSPSSAIGVDNRRISKSSIDISNPEKQTKKPVFNFFKSIKSAFKPSITSSSIPRSHDYSYSPRSPTFNTSLPTVSEPAATERPPVPTALPLKRTETTESTKSNHSAKSWVSGVDNTSWPNFVSSFLSGKNTSSAKQSGGTSASNSPNSTPSNSPQPFYTSSIKSTVSDIPSLPSPTLLSLHKSSPLAPDTSSLNSSSSSALRQSNPASGVSTMRKDKTKLNQEETLCRICEEIIETRFMEVHSQVCKIAQELEVEMYNCDLRLRKLVGTITKWRNEVTDSPGTDSYVKVIDYLIKVANRLANIDEKRPDASIKCKKYTSKIRRNILGESSTNSTASSHGKWNNEKLTMLAKRVVEVCHSVL